VNSRAASPVWVRFARELAYLCLIALRTFSQKTPYVGINAEAASQGFSRKPINRMQIAGGTDVTSAPAGDDATAVWSLNKSVVKRAPGEIDSVGRLIAFLPSRLMSSVGFDAGTYPSRRDTSLFKIYGFLNCVTRESHCTATTIGVAILRDGTLWRTSMFDGFVAD
jgi:hypothetical protein